MVSSNPRRCAPAARRALPSLAAVNDSPCGRSRELLGRPILWAGRGSLLSVARPPSVQPSGRAPRAVRTTPPCALMWCAAAPRTRNQRPTALFTLRSPSAGCLPRAASTSLRPRRPSARVAALAAVWAATARRPRHRSRPVGRPCERVASAARARPLWPPLCARGRVGAGRPAGPRGAVCGCGIGPGVPQGRGGAGESVGEGSRVRPTSPTRAGRVVSGVGRIFGRVARACDE
jgi:hypothetical protein